MHTLDLDDEQAAILLAGLECADAMLTARAARVDPQGKISDAIAVSRQKTKQIRLQLEGGAMGSYGDLSDQQQMKLQFAAKVLGRSHTEPEMQEAYNLILQVVLANRIKRKTIDATPREV